MKFFFFWGGILSNFHQFPKQESSEFTSSEQAYMFTKASFFGDTEIATKILKSTTPKEAKKLGRKVQNFNQQAWDFVKTHAMDNALRMKANHCPEFVDFLLSTGNDILIEASPFDRIWGIGFDEENALANQEKWGQNLLGKCLMELREKLYPVGDHGTNIRRNLEFNFPRINS